MARPTNPSDHTTVVIKSSVFGKTGLQTSIDLKAVRYISDDTVYWEMRHVLADFYGEDDLDDTWETSKVVKKQFDGVKHMLEEPGFNVWNVVVPSRKAYESKKAFYIAHDVKPTRVQDEWQISTLGLIVWLCVCGRTHDKQTLTRSVPVRCKRLSSQHFCTRPRGSATRFSDGIQVRSRTAIFSQLLASRVGVSNT